MRRLQGLAVFLLLTGCTAPAPDLVECPEIGSGCRLDGLTVATDRMPEIMKPFELTLQWDGKEADGIREVHVSFAMEGMEMGLNRYRLEKRSDTLWQAEVTLPVCVRGRSDWLMQIDAKTRFGSRRHMLTFHTG
ncbi:MAG TPA: hypothetical protein VIK69_01330 [Methylophilaceae bacterium]